MFAGLIGEAHILELNLLEETEKAIIIHAQHIKMHNTQRMVLLIMQ